MSRSNTPPSPETPHLVSLVLHSKKALQHGEQLCTRAHELTHATSAVATDVLALDAKARWITQGIQEQLKLAGTVAKTIEVQRSRLDDQAKEWDKARSFHSGNLDTILESLERQLVPPGFHLSSSSSSIFGSQHTDGEDSEAAEEGVSNEDRTKARSDTADRSKWKTLRDFVDFAGIVKATEEMDDDRDILDDILAKTEGFPIILSESIASLKDSLPVLCELPSIKDVFDAQEALTTNMANHLEGLASHYEQMAAALRDKETGMEFTEEDLQEMNRDTDELPSIITELEDDVASIKSSHDQLQSTKNTILGHLRSLSEILQQLDELEGVMADMLDQQQAVEAEYEMHLASIQQHLTTLEHLYITYISYETSYNSLLLELERRRRYRDATEDLVYGMVRQLDACVMVQEIQLRESFYATHGPHLPDDLCYCVANMPTKWDVGPALGEVPEELPDVDEDLLVEAMKRMDLVKDVTESL
ncbi:autophagy-related protein 17 [Phellopilus nigrolimitatus]|nr:autophagy-related protein 17 [Phellopilus nigrolimitatus]